MHYQLSVFSAQWKATNIITRSSLSQFSVLHCFSGFGFVSIVLFSSVFSLFLLVFLVHSSKLKCSCFLVLFGFIVAFIPKNCTLFFSTQRLLRILSFSFSISHTLSIFSSHSLQMCNFFSLFVWNARVGCFDVCLALRAAFLIESILNCACRSCIYVHIAHTNPMENFIELVVLALSSSFPLSLSCSSLFLISKCTLNRVFTTHIIDLFHRFVLNPLNSAKRSSLPTSSSVFRVSRCVVGSAFAIHTVIQTTSISAHTILARLTK